MGDPGAGWDIPANCLAHASPLMGVRECRFSGHRAFWCWHAQVPIPPPVWPGSGSKGSRHAQAPGLSRPDGTAPLGMAL